VASKGLYTDQHTGKRFLVEDLELATQSDRDHENKAGIVFTTNAKIAIAKTATMVGWKEAHPNGGIVIPTGSTNGFKNLYPFGFDFDPLPGEKGKVVDIAAELLERKATLVTTHYGANHNEPNR
jgi:hypothetical protein